MKILIVKTDKKHFCIRNAWEYTTGIDFIVRVDSTEMLQEFTYWNYYHSQGDYFHVNEHKYQPLYLVGTDYNTGLQKYCKNVYWKTVEDDDMIMLFCFKGSILFKDTMVVPVTNREAYRFADEKECDLISRLIFNTMKRWYGVSFDDKLKGTRRYVRFCNFCDEHGLSHLL